MKRGDPPEPDSSVRDQLEQLPCEPISVRIATAVKLTGIGRSTLYELISSGQIDRKDRPLYLHSVPLFEASH